MENPNPGDSQNDPIQDVQAETQGKKKTKKRKCNFSEEENEILVSEVMQNEHLLFCTSKLPLVRKEAIWKSIVDKVNSVSTMKREVIDCKKRWHGCKLRTKANWSVT